MTNEAQKEIKLTPAEESPWYKFMKFTIDLDDQNTKPEGSHWFWGLCYLRTREINFPYIDIKLLQNKLPDEHWLKKIKIDEHGNPTGMLFNGIVREFSKGSEFRILKDYLKTIEDSKKLRKIDFSNLDFKKTADFSNLIFPIDADFNNSKFSEKSIFTNTTFFETADFKGAEFNGETAKFRNTDFQKIADFSSTIFNGYANFKSSKLKGRTSFQRAKFKFHAPRFYGAEFNNEMTFFGMVPPKFFSIFPPKLIRTSDEKLDKSPKNIIAFWIDRKKKKKKYRQRIQENQNSYENTAILLEERKKYHDQHLFYRAEMRCRRRLERFFLLRWSYIFYEYLANYGYGFGHAFIWWLLNIGIGFYMLRRINHHAHSIVDSPIRCSILTSFANAHSFLFLHNGPLKGCYATFKALPEFSFVWGFQTIAGIPLLFLLLLTLRIRFRLK